MLVRRLLVGEEDEHSAMAWSFPTYCTADHAIMVEKEFPSERQQLSLARMIYGHPTDYLCDQPGPVCVNEATESRLCQARASHENFGEVRQVIADAAKELIPRAAVAVVLSGIVDMVSYVSYARFLGIELLNLSVVLIDQDHGA